MRRRVRTAANKMSFLTTPTRKLSLSGYVGRAEGSLKRHGRNSDGDGAIVVLSVSF